MAATADELLDYWRSDSDPKNIGEGAVKNKRFTEHELLKGLDERTAHADEAAEPLSQELDPLERLKGSVKRYDRPTDPVWDDYFDSEGASDDFMEDREQPDSEDRGQ